jgi:hypothetical protein
MCESEYYYVFSEPASFVSRLLNCFLSVSLLQNKIFPVTMSINTLCRLA